MARRIAARSGEMESQRRIPADIMADLRAAGVFRLFVSRKQGGFELDLMDALKILVELARIDGSVGWNAMTSSVISLFLPLLPEQTYKRIYRNGPDVVFSGSSRPSGTAVPAKGGWRVTGRWPFASGSQNANWIAAFCVPTADGEPLLNAAGQPRIGAVCLPAEDWQVHDTWYVAGLKATGSNDIELRDRTVPAANMVDLDASAPCVSGPLYQVVEPLVPFLHSAPALGIAEAIVDDLIALANSGRQQLMAPTRMRDSETFQFELGRVVADLRATQAYFQAEGQDFWRHAVAGTLMDDGLRPAELTQAAIWITESCVRIADACFALAGASAVYDSSPMQRRLRDLHVVGQHARIQRRQYAGIGKLLLGSGVKRGDCEDGGCHGGIVNDDRERRCCRSDRPSRLGALIVARRVRLSAPSSQQASSQQERVMVDDDVRGIWLQSLILPYPMLVGIARRRRVTGI